MVSLSPPPVFCVMVDIKRGGGGWKGKIFPILCWHVSSPTHVLPSPVLKAKATGFPLAKFLIPLCIPELLVILVALPWNAPTLGACVLTVKSIKVHFNWNIILDERRAKRPGKVRERGILKHSGNIRNMTQANVCYQSVICMSPSTFFPCLLPHTSRLSFI